jgi:hypothetical protein
LLAAEERASARFNAQRANIQRWIKDHEAREQWDGAREFLDYWWDGEMAEVAARFHWKLLALPGDAPIQLLFGNEPWRLMVDIEAMLMYARCVVFEQAKKVGYVDLIQLLYMSIRRKRVLVTNDMPFFHAATAVLTGRYANAKVITLSQLME